MSTSLLHLQQNVLVKILGFVEDKSVFRLREVCHGAMEIVDSTILKTRKNVVDLFTCIIRGPKESQIFFYFETLTNYSLWKINMKYLSRDVETARFEFFGHIKFIKATIAPGNIVQFMESLKAFIKLTTFNQLNIWETNHEMVEMYSNFFIGKSVRKLCMDPVTNDFSPFLAFIRQLKPAIVDCALLLTKDSIEYMIQIADIVSSLHFPERKDSKQNRQQNILPFVLALARSKCKIIHFKSFHNRCVSLADAETLLEKKVAISAVTNAEHLNVHIGEYKIKVSDQWNRKQIEMKHLGMF